MISCIGASGIAQLHDAPSLAARRHTLTRDSSMHPNASPAHHRAPITASANHPAPHRHRDGRRTRARPAIGWFRSCQNETRGREKRAHSPIYFRAKQSRFNRTPKMGNPSNYNRDNINFVKRHRSTVDRGWIREQLPAQHAWAADGSFLLHHANHRRQQLPKQYLLREWETDRDDDW